MKTDTLNKIMLAISVFVFIFALYIHIAFYDLSFIAAVVVVALGSVGAGSAICFAGLLLAGKSKRVFGWVVIIQLIIYFVMSLAAPLTVLIAGSATMQIDYLGLLSIPAVVAVMILLFIKFYGKKPAHKKAGYITSAVVAVIFAVLGVKSCIGAEWFNAVNTVLQNLLICALAGYSVLEAKDEKI